MCDSKMRFDRRSPFLCAVAYLHICKCESYYGPSCLFRSSVYPSIHSSSGRPSVYPHACSLLLSNRFGPNLREWFLVVLRPCSLDFIPNSLSRLVTRTTDFMIPVLTSLISAFTFLPFHLPRFLRGHPQKRMMHSTPLVYASFQSEFELQFLLQVTRRIGRDRRTLQPRTARFSIVTTRWICSGNCPKRNYAW